MNPWLWLLLAGAMEVAWSQSIRPTEGFTRPVATVVCVLLALGVIYPLAQAMQGVPVGTAYVVFTGIGGVGAVALGVLFAGDALTVSRLAGAVLVVAGVAILRVSGNE